jgi:hypothetical protein
LPIPIVLKLIGERDGKMKREYLKKKKDVHENDVNFLINSRKSAMWLVNKIPNFYKIDCSMKGDILSRESIHEKVYREVKKVLK